MRIVLVKLNGRIRFLSHRCQNGLPLIVKLPPLRAVQIFEVVGRVGSVTRAAEELGVSPGAITQHIRTLEKHLGVRVVRRSGRGIELTTWGTIYLQRVLAAIEQLRKAQDDVDRARRSNHLSVSALPSLATKWLGPLLFDWKARHPNASVLIEGVDGEPRLDEGDADFRISYGARRRAHKRYLHLFTDHVVAVASPALIAASGPLGHPRDLVRKPLLWIDWGPEYIAPPTWRDWMIAAGVSAEHLQCNLTFSLSSAAVDAAIEGRGFALAQYSMAATALSNGALVKIFPQTLPLPEAYFLAWNGSAVDKPLAAAFHAWLLAEARRFDSSNTHP